MSSAQLVYGPVTVTWRADDSIEAITYGGDPLIQTVNNRLQSLQLSLYGFILPQELCDLIDNLLNSIASLPVNEKRRKIFLADKMFEHLVINTNPPNPKLRGMIWRAILDRVWRWEDLHEKVHKGTAYYFMAETYLGSGDIPSAYICFFNALEEDKLNYPFIPKNLKDAPAYLTTSLVDNPNNALHTTVVMPLRAYLQNFIDSYNNARTRRNLTLKILDQKFLQFDPLEDIKRFFVATFHEIYHLAPMNSARMINNDYSKLKIIDTLFNLSLIVDQLLEYRFLQHALRRDMANAIYRLALHLNWTTSTRDRDVPQFLGRIQPDLNSGSPDQIVPSLLNGLATFDGRNINLDMRAVFLAYHLRNFAGHHIKGQDILVNRYPEVLNGVMDALFVAIEVL